MKTEVKLYFEKYADLFNAAIGGSADLEDIASLYSSEFIAASPAGVNTGKNDDQLKAAMAQGYAQYQSTGMKEMKLRSVSVVPLDELHCVANVSWQATYQIDGKPDIVVDFVNHYFIQTLDDTPKVFGWVTGDEKALLQEHGIG